MDSQTGMAQDLHKENAQLREEISKLQDEGARLKNENETLRRDQTIPPSAALDQNDWSHDTEDDVASADERIALIQENLQEVLKPEIIEDVISRQKRPLVIYWGADASNVLPTLR